MMSRWGTRLHFGRLFKALAIICLWAQLPHFALLLSTIPTHASDFNSKAEQVYLIDGKTGTVLYAKNENDLIPPASLAKLMTMEVVFHAIKNGELTLSTEFSVSEHAWRTGGAPSGTSTMFAELGSKIRVEDLIKGAIVQSGNDSTIILAEGMAGSETAFAERMTQRARELGLMQSVFKNPTGLPQEGAYVTMKELVHLAQHIYQTYPDFYPIFSEKEFTWNEIRQFNRAPLINANIGVDGLKTGYTEASGYAIVSSIAQNGQRLYLAMSGLKDTKERQEETRRLFEWAFAHFQNQAIFDKGQVIGQASVFGSNETVRLAPGQDVDILLPAGNQSPLKARIIHDWPLKAPIEDGDQIGEVRIWVGERLSRTEPLYATHSVKKGTITHQAWDALKELLLFWL